MSLLPCCFCNVTWMQGDPQPFLLALTSFVSRCLGRSPAPSFPIVTPKWDLRWQAIGTSAFTSRLQLDSARSFSCAGRRRKTITRKPTAKMNFFAAHCTIPMGGNLSIALLGELYYSIPVPVHNVQVKGWSFGHSTRQVAVLQSLRVERWRLLHPSLRYASMSLNESVLRQRESA